MTVALRCTVRGCGAALTPGGEALRCARGHSFDRAREGYWNLVQPQDRRSPKPGDSAAALAARRRWLARGFAGGLVATAGRLLDEHGVRPGGTVLDLGCGEGTLARQLFAGRHLVCLGIDLSARGCAMAARLWPEATIVAANVDRGIPALDAAIDLVVSLFGRRPWAEVARVLRPGGLFLAVRPGAEDLVELRRAVLGAGRLPERAVGVADGRADGAHEGAGGLAIVASAHWSDRRTHDMAALRDALDMSYRGGRAARRARLEELQDLDVTLAADLDLWRRDTGRP